MNAVRSFNGMTPAVGKGVYIDPMSAVIGDVVLADEVSVWPMTSIRGDLLQIRIGYGTNIQDGSVLHTSQDSEFCPGGAALGIGEKVTVGHKVLLHGCTVHNHVVVGMGAIVLDGAIVHDEVMIAAGAVVPPGKELASGYLYSGTPARQARPLKEKEKAFIYANAHSYIDCKNQHMANQ